MPRSIFRFSVFALIFCCAPLFSQSVGQANQAKPQTARQALIEMVSQGGETIKRHLTIEVQDLLKSEKVGFPKIPGIESFETGEVLFAYTEPGRNLKYEVHIDNDDFSGNEETFLLSVHAFKDDKEQDDSWSLLSSHFTVSMKLQQNLWRLNKLSVGAEIPIGDPEFIKKAFLDKADKALAASAGGIYTPHATIQFDSSGAASSPSTFAPQQVITLLAYAETTFARMHPDKGFTCSLAELEEASKMMGVDPQVSTGSYNGYRFALAGCQGKPAGSYQLIAEPLVLTSGAKAFCTDATSNVRVSDDGRAATCLTSGKLPADSSAEGGLMGVQLSVPEDKPEK